MFKHHHRDREKTSSSNSASNSSIASGLYPNPGINNLGNSCFLNSVIQGLAASRPLRDALAAYPGAERVLKASHTSQTAGSTDQADSKPAHNDGAASVSSSSDNPDSAEIDRISAVAEQQRQGLEHSLSSPTVLTPGTPTTETSPALQLLTEDPFPDSLPLSSALASTLVKLWSGKQSTINVKNLMRELNRRNEDWNEWDQMDAHELLRFLLDGVSMEEIDLIKKLQTQPDIKAKQKKKKKQKGARPVAEVLRRKAAQAAGETLLSSESEDTSSDEDDMSSSEAESLLAEDPSYRMPPRDPPPPRYTPFIDTIFGGKLASVIVCEECRGVSRIEEDFLDISLPIKGDDGKVRRRDRLLKFLGSSSSLSKESERPRMAPRAPTNILNPSESEVSDTEDGGATSALEPQGSSNASISSGSAATSSSGRNNAEKRRSSSKEEDLEEGATAVRRRKSLDPATLRSQSPRKGILSTKDDTRSRSRERSLISRGASLRVSGGTDSSKTIASGKSKGSDTSTARKKGKQSNLLAKPTKEQQDYIRKLFAEIPLPSINSSPLAQLRIAQPGGHHTHHSIPTPTAAETNGSPLAMADVTETGLYQCLVQFTSVELLDGENAFQCRRCWKLLHPELVAQVGRKRAAKAMQKKEEAENKRLVNMKSTLLDDTPRASFSAGSDLLGGSIASEESMIAKNRKLLAERERQLAEANGTAAPASFTEGIPGTVPSQGMLNSSAPDILITANSPPVSHTNDPLQSAFSSLSTSESRTSSGSVSVPGSQASLGLPTSSMSDLGAEADEEDRSDLSDVDQSNGDISTGSGIRNSPDGLNVSDKAVSSAGNRQKTAVARPNPSHMPVPTLPPRSQRFVPRRAHKRYLISSLPPILVLHLKRFQQTHKSMFSSFGDLKKLDDKITFPLYLDMAPFMAPPPLIPTEPSAVERVLASGLDGLASGSGSLKSGDESDNNGKSSRAQSKSWFRRSAPSAEIRSNCVYRLYAVIVHKGSMGSGHYVAMTYTSQRKHEGTQVKAPTTSGGGQHDAVTRSDPEAARQWIYCSDDLVRPASVDEVFKSQAYLLMYERVDPPEKLPAKR